uniref:hypothetical protein n=1 Tax=Oceanivirga salmonicida TaxID=1769291 RepID=UPI0018CC0424
QKGILDNFSSKFGEGYDKNFRKSHKEVVTKALIDGNKEKKLGNTFAQYIVPGEKEIISLKSDYEIVGQKVKLSELSGTDIKLEVEDKITNKDSIIKAENSNVIKTKVFNNISTVKKENFEYRDGIEKLAYREKVTYWFNKLYNVNNWALYERKLSDKKNTKEVDLYLPNSELIGKDIVLETKETNFEGHGQSKIVKGKLSNLYLKTNKLNIDNFGLHHTNISVESDNIRLKNGGLIADNQLNIKTKKLETTGDKT